MLNRTDIKTLRQAALDVHLNDTERCLSMFDSEQVEAIQNLCAFLPDILALCDRVLDDTRAQPEHSPYWHRMTAVQSGSDGVPVPGSCSGDVILAD